MKDISDLAAIQYADGRTPIEVAELTITSLLTVRDAISQRPVTTSRLPMWPNADDEALARKIIAALMDDGWTPPTQTAVADAARRSIARREQLAQWRAGLTDEQRAIVLEHYSQTGEYPPACQPPPEVS